MTIAPRSQRRVTHGAIGVKVATLSPISPMVTQLTCTNMLKRTHLDVRSTAVDCFGSNRELLSGRLKRFLDRMGILGVDMRYLLSTSSVNYLHVIYCSLLSIRTYFN